MLNITLDEQHGIATLEPDGPLGKDDFHSAAGIIDPFIEKSGHLNGLIIHTESFPGWDSFQAMHSHLTFVKEHHKKVPRIAFVTDSVISNLAETIGSHFVSADIKSFDYGELDKARAWILGDS
jgi:hypothetical protein